MFFISCKAFLIHKSHLETETSQIPPPWVLSILALDQLCRNEKIVHFLCLLISWSLHRPLFLKTKKKKNQELPWLWSVALCEIWPIFSNCIFNVRRCLILRLASFFIGYAVKGRRRAGQVAVCRAPQLSVLPLHVVTDQWWPLGYSRCLEEISETILPLLGFQLKGSLYMNVCQNVCRLTAVRKVFGNHCGKGFL